MYRIFLQKTLLASITLLTFLFSANALYLGDHLAEDMKDAVHFASYDDGGPSSAPEHFPSADHHHGHGHAGHGDGHADGGGCCAHTHHSHDLTGGPSLTVLPSAGSTEIVFVETTPFLPEVFLERFIPPQNLS